MAQKPREWLGLAKTLLGLPVVVAGLLKLGHGEGGPIAIGLTAAGLLIGGLAWVAFQRTKSKASPGEWRYPRWRRAARNSLIAIAALAVIGGGYDLYQKSLPPTKVILVVANFDGPEPQKYGVTDTVLNRLRQKLDRYDDVEIQPLGHAITEVEGSAAAKKEGKHRRACIVIWGWYRATGQAVRMSVHFEVLRPPRYLPQFGATVTGAPQTIEIAAIESFALQTSLSSEMAYLSLFTLGMVRFAGGDQQGAIARFTEALGEAEHGRPALDTATIYAYRGEAHFLNRNLPNALADYDHAIQLNPDSQASAYAGRGGIHALTGDLERALADFDRAIQINPDFAVAYSNRGGVYRVIGDLDRALADLDQAIKLKPDFSGAYVNRAAVQCARGDYDRCLGDYNQAIRLNSTFAGSYLGRGITYMDRGDLNRALADFDRAIRLDPKLAGAYANRGVVYQRTNDPKRAEADFDQLVTVDRNSAEAYRIRADHRAQTGDLQGAFADWDRAIELRPTSAEAHVARGVAFGRIGELERAFADFNAALELNSASAAAYAGRGGIYAMNNDLDSALADFNRAIELDPRLDVAYYGRGGVYAVWGEKDKAIADFQKVIQLNRPSTLPAQARDQLSKLGVK